MELKYLTNDQLFPVYYGDLALRIMNEKNLKCIRQFLGRFKDYLGNYPPSEELAKGFLAKFTSTKPHTFYNYVGEIKRFMKWYGEPLDLKAKLPKSLPTYHEDSEISKILDVILAKKTHKACRLRDGTLVILAIKTGLRRTELANLEARDIHDDFLVVRQGKGKKDRVVPLSPGTAAKLHSFIKEMPPNQKIFGLNPTTLGMKIKDLAKRAGLPDLHCHSLRHKFATDLLEKGANIKQVQALLGHASISSTQVYLALSDKALNQAINLLDQETVEPKGEPYSPGVAILTKIKPKVVEGK